MKSVVSYSLLGLLAFLLSLLLLAPATLVTNQISARLPGFGVQAVEGLATAGAARGIRWRDAQIERLAWRWQPLALLTGWLAFRLDADDLQLKLVTSAALGLDRRIRFQELSGRLPLGKLGMWAKQPKLPLQGFVEFNMQHLYLNPAGLPLTAEGVAHLRELRITLGQALSLGDFTVRLTPGQPEGVEGALKDNNGPLALDGVLHLAPDGRYRFNGQAVIRDPSNQPLRQAMNLLGPPGSDGRWMLSFSGVLAR